MKKIIQLLICTATPLVLGMLSGVGIVVSDRSWYAQLQKPVFNPPNYLFGPVWTMLYVLMGISVYLILQSKDKKRKNWAISIFIFQFSLNLLWSPLFFYFQQIAWAMVDIILMWFGIFFMLIIFYKINKKAALLQIPYLLWVSFASALNFYIWQLN